VKELIEWFWLLPGAWAGLILLVVAAAILDSVRSR
jgi:hypothetical protein